MKTPDKISKQIDLRNVRGGSIPGSRTMMNKKDKENTRRELNKKARNWRDEMDESDVDYSYGMDDDEDVFSVDDVVDTSDGKIGVVAKRFEDGDELSYKVEFEDGTMDFYQGYQLKLHMDDEYNESSRYGNMIFMVGDRVQDRRGRGGTVVKRKPYGNGLYDYKVKMDGDYFLTDYDSTCGCLSPEDSDGDGRWDESSKARKSDDMVDVDVEMWEIVDKVQNLLKSDDSIETVDLMDDQPPAIQIRTKKGTVVGLTFEAY